MPTIFEVKHAILMQEWQMCQQSVGRFDTITFTIRSWAITLSAAAIAYAWIENQPDICILIIPPIVALWLLDALYKTFQRNFIDRGREIERYMASAQFVVDHAAQGLPKGITIPDTAAAFHQDRPLLLSAANVLQRAVLWNVIGVYVALLAFAICARALIAI